MNLRPEKYTRKLVSVAFPVLLLLLPLQHTSAEFHQPAQSKVVAIGILDFSDESDTNAPPQLGRRLGQQLRQRLATGFPDLLPKSVSQNSETASVAALTVEQLVALGKQNALQFVIRPGMLALASDEQANVKVQLYAEIISVESGGVNVVRAEGAAANPGAAPGAAIQWNNLGQGVTFATSAPGKALSTGIELLAASIHEAIQSPAVEASTTEPLTSGGNEPATSTSAEPMAAAESANTADAADAEADEELQQLIAQAEELVSSGSANAKQLTAIRSAMDTLKTALTSKASLVERGADPADADHEISSNKEALQAAVAALTEQIPAADSSAGESAPTSEKKSLLSVIDQRAGEVIGILQKIQEMRSVARGAAEDPSLGKTDAMPESEQNLVTEQPTEEVAGVVTESGQPVAGVTVTDADSDVTAITGPDGSYALKAIPGKLSTLVLKKDGKQIATGQVDLLRGRPAVADFDVKPNGKNALRVIPSTVVLAGNPKAGATGTLKGIARDKTGKPMARALVRIEGLAMAMARTDSNGNYSFLRVPAGERVVTVRKAGSKPVSTKVSVSANKISEAQSQLTPDLQRATGVGQRVIVRGSGTSLGGKIVNEGSKPVAGAKVVLLQATSAVSVMTSKDGNYELKDLRPGTYTVLVSKIGYENSKRTITQRMGKTEAQNFQLKKKDSPYVAKVIEARSSRPAPVREPAREPARKAETAIRPLQTRGGALTGHVVDALSRRPIAGATVSIAGRSTKTDQGGVYALVDLAPGNYQIKVTSAGFAEDLQSTAIRAGASSRQEFALKRLGDSSNRTPRVLPSTPQATKTTTPARLGQVRGRVVDAATIAPIAGAVVVVSGQPRVVTGRDGTYSLSALPPGSYQVSISRPGFAEKRTAFTIRAGEVTNADFRLTAAIRKAIR